MLISHTHTYTIIFYLTVFASLMTPISHALTNIALALILLIFLLSKSLLSYLKIILNHPIALSVVLFLSIVALGLLYTINDYSGARQLEKYLPFLAMPILLAVLDKKSVQPILIALTIGLFISALLSYGVILGLYSSHYSANSLPFFNSRIVHGVLLSFGVAIMFYYFAQTQQLKYKVLLVLGVLFLGLNIFLTQGRAGQVGFVVIVMLFLLVHYRHAYKKLFAGLLLFLIFLTANYTLNESFKQRVNDALFEAQHYKDVKNTSVGLRIHMNINAFTLIKQNPWFGVGTGGYGTANAQFVKENNLKLQIFGHPHNQYLLVLVEHGIIGLVAFLALFAFLIYFTYKLRHDGYFFLRVSLVGLYMTVMLSDVYLSLLMNQVLFILISSALFSNAFLFSRKPTV